MNARLAAVVVPLLVASAACQEQEAAPRSSPVPAQTVEGDTLPGGLAPSEATVVADEYEYRDVPPILGSGQVTLTLDNRGKEPHELLLIQLTGGTTLQDFLQLTPERARKRLRRNGSATAKPGRTDTLTTTLSAGAWSMVCLIESPSGLTHLEQGMTGGFGVA